MNTRKRHAALAHRACPIRRGGRLDRQFAELRHAFLGDADRLKMRPDTHGPQERLHDATGKQARGDQLTDGDFAVEHHDRTPGRDGDDGQVREETAERLR